MKLMVTIAAICLQWNGLAQAIPGAHRPNFTAGLELGAVMDPILAGETFWAMETERNLYGFYAGVVLDYRLSPKFNLRSKLGVSHSKEEGYKYDPKTETRFEPALHLAYKLKDHTLNPYFFFGPRGRLLISPSHTFYKSDLAVDLGFGVEKPGNERLFALELRYSPGITEVYYYPVYRHTIVLSIAVR